MYFLNSLLSSFLRTIGRILAYLIIGMAILLVINEVKASTYQPLEVNGFAPDVEYPGQCVDGVCFVDVQVQNLLENPLVTNVNLYYGNIENPSTKELHMRGTFWSYGMDALNNPFNLNLLSFKVHMLDIDSYVNDNACTITTSNTILGFLDNPLTTTLYNYECSWSASAPHNYELVVFVRVPSAYELPRQLYYQFENMLFTTDEVDVNDTLEDGFNNIITNQNQNSQNIINNQNTNQQQTNQGLANIDKTNKSILQNIIDIPKKVVDLIVEAIKFLFIPDETYFNLKFDELRTNAESKLGFLGYPFILVVDTLEYLVNVEDNGHYVISWEDIHVPNFEDETPIIKAGSFDFATLLEKDVIKNIRNIYLVFIRALLILAFLKLCHNAYVSAFGGQYDDTEYVVVTDSESYYDDKSGTWERRSRSWKEKRKDTDK